MTGQAKDTAECRIFMPESKELTVAIKMANLAPPNWKVFAVGGFVRDRVLGLESKDLDLEVFGPDSVGELIAWLKRFGAVNAVGRSFGVLKLTVDGVDLDVSLPRRESKNGTGHKGFIVEPDSSITLREAASRRDFTMNALAMTLPECKVVDYFRGVRSLELGMIRHTSAAFADDPLRVLRGFQFAGRFNLIVSFCTMDLCAGLLFEAKTLSHDRIWGEWQKWVTKSTVPSRGLEFLVDTCWLDLWPELVALRECGQAPCHHPEGNVWLHTLHTVDSMINICNRETITGEDRVVLVLAALLHDVGKPATTEWNQEKERLTAFGHGEAGVGPSVKFLRSIGCPHHIVDRVTPLVQHHMRHVNFFTGGQVCAKHVRRLARDLGKATVSEWALVVEADHLGRPPLLGGMPESAKKFVEIAKELQVIDARPKPILMGRHLIEAGMTPGKRFGLILRVAFEAQLDGAFSDLDGARNWLMGTLLPVEVLAK